MGHADLITQFSDTYYLVNQKTRQAVERRYDQTEVFTTGAEAFGPADATRTGNRRDS